jgi:hypothetical protein
MVTAKGLNDAKARTTLPLYLKDSALRWYISLEDENYVHHEHFSF